MYMYTNIYVIYVYVYKNIYVYIYIEKFGTILYKEGYNMRGISLHFIITEVYYLLVKYHKPKQNQNTVKCSVFIRRPLNSTYTIKM